ncbi:MAG: Crp/Fnr family transcriptional regulator [Chitinophagaceae bacterium]|nr:Crp/Fnr family transcriptional regulator [Chitinophagaceae bacterium]
MKQLNAGCNTDICQMCRNCSTHWLPAIQSNRKNFIFKKNALLFREGEEMKGIFFVHSGLVKVHKRWGEEKELIVRFARDGDIVGHRGIGKDQVFPVSATAIETTTVCYVELDFFLSTLRVNPEYLFRLMMFYAAELKESEKFMGNLAHMPVKGRIAHALVSLEEKFGQDSEGRINITLSRQDLASYIGTTYETLFRMLTEMAAEGLLRINKRISIVDKDTLLRKFVS